MQSDQQSKDPAQEACDDAAMAEYMCMTRVQLGMCSKEQARSAIDLYHTLVARGQNPREARSQALRHCSKSSPSNGERKLLPVAHRHCAKSSPSNGERQLLPDAKEMETLCGSLASTQVDPVANLAQLFSTPWNTSTAKEPIPRRRELARQRTFDDVLEHNAKVYYHARAYLRSHGLTDRWDIEDTCESEVSTVVLTRKGSRLRKDVLEIDVRNGYTCATLKKELDRLFRTHG